MRRIQLHDDYVRVGQGDLCTLDIGNGTIHVDKFEGTKARTYKLEPVYVQLVRAAYERGLAGRAAYRT